MERAILARHGESEFSALGSCNGDPTVEGGKLTERGREQSHALGRALAHEPLDLVVVTEFRRTRETADVAVGDRALPLLVIPELNDVRFGSFEGCSLEEYRVWAWASGPTDPCPGGGEARAEAAARYARALRLLLARPEQTALVVAHALPVQYALRARDGLDPSMRVDPVEHAAPYPFTAGELDAVAARLERWARAPVFA